MPGKVETPDTWHMVRTWPERPCATYDACHLAGEATTPDDKPVTWRARREWPPCP